MAQAANERFHKTTLRQIEVCLTNYTAKLLALQQKENRRKLG